MNYHIHHLPDDITKYIFGLLSGKNRANICTVCSTWNTLSCITTLSVLPKTKRDLYRDFHMFAIFKPANNTIGVTYACRMGNTEVFKHLHNMRHTGFLSQAWFDAVGKSGNIEILDHLVNIHKYSLCNDTIIIAAVAAGNRNNVELLYKCLDYIKIFQCVVYDMFRDIYRGICKKCSRDTLRALEDTDIAKQIYDLRHVKQYALAYACEFSNFDVIDYLAPVIGELTFICVNACKWNNNVGVYLMEKYADKIDTREFHKYSVAQQITILTKLPQTFTREQVNELREKYSGSCYYLWSMDGMIRYTYEKEINDAVAIWERAISG